MAWQDTNQPHPPENRRFSAFRDLLEIIRDYGMPTTAFGTGIYAFIVALQVEMAPELKAIVALVLTLMGLTAQLWVYSRENPKVHNDEVREQLLRMTLLVERLVEDRMKRNDDNDKAGKTKP